MLLPRCVLLSGSIILPPVWDTEVGRSAFGLRAPFIDLFPSHRLSRKVIGQEEHKDVAVPAFEQYKGR